MKLIEALKAQKKINDKINRNCELLAMYSSKLSIEKPYFESDDEQRLEVKKLIEANLQYVNEFLWLRRCIEYTNVNTKVELLEKSYTIADLLNLKRVAGTMILNTFKALNDSSSSSRLIQYNRIKTDRNISIERFYDEREKNQLIKEWQDILDSIDSKLEIVNVITDLMEIPNTKINNNSKLDSINKIDMNTNVNESGVIL